MRNCSHCSSLLREESCTCPHCGHNPCGGPSRAALLLGLALTGCVGATPQPKYGVSITDSQSSMVDEDGDGYTAKESGGDDCDDSDPNIHPDAEETAGDGVDSNCDGSDDT